MVGHITVEKVIVLPANNPRVRPDPVEAVLDVMGGDRVKGTMYVQERSKTVPACVNVAFYIVSEGRGGSFGGFVAAEAMLLRGERVEADALLHMPGVKTLEGFKELVGEGDRAVGGRLGI